MKLYTTFALCKKHGACAPGFNKLARKLGGVRVYGKHMPIPLARIIETNGVVNAIWALRAVPAEQSAASARIASLFACDCAERVLHLFEAKHPGDDRLRRAIEVARRFANGNATSRHPRLGVINDRGQTM